MKETVLVAFCAFAALQSSALEKDQSHIEARTKGAMAQMKLLISNDKGEPVPDASIHVLMGMNFRERSYDVDGKSDTNGLFVVEGKTTGNEVIIEATKDGYYKSSQKLSFIKMGDEFDVKDGRWQPWGMMVELPMRKVVNPVELLAFHDGIQVPVTNTWIGFDMKKKDWVASGRGGEIPDFEAMVQWDGRPMATLEFAQMDIRFVGKGAGFYFADKVIGSAFTGVYNADTNRAFQTEFTCRAMRKDGAFSDSGVPKGKLMVVRSRCKLDDKGNIMEANYAAIRSLFIEGGWNGKAEAIVNYQFNPTPNDTNLEPSASQRNSGVSQ